MCHHTTLGNFWPLLDSGWSVTCFFRCNCALESSLSDKCAQVSVEKLPTAAATVPQALYLYSSLRTVKRHSKCPNIPTKAATGMQAAGTASRRLRKVSSSLSKLGDFPVAAERRLSTVVDGEHR